MMTGNFFLEWTGPGWYADLGRSFEGESYVEGARIATFDEFDPETGATITNDGELDTPYIWDTRCGRGTPYPLK